MKTILDDKVEEAQRLSQLIPDFGSWLAQNALGVPDDARLVDTVLFYVWHSVNEQCVELDTLPEEVVAFYQKNEDAWLDELVKV